MVKKLSPILLLGFLLTGCTSTRITNLTPPQQVRNDNGLYSVEAILSSRQQTMRWPTIKPSAVMDTNFFPMRLTPLMTNRWETLIKVPPGKNVVYYRFKFVYDYNVMGSPGKTDSKLSPTYRLLIVDK